MSEHIAAFAEIFNRLGGDQIASPETRARITAGRILNIFDNSADVPGEIEALLRDQFAAAERHGALKKMRRG